MRWPVLTLGISIATIFARGDPTTTTTGIGKWSIWDEKTGEELSIEQIAQRYTRRTEGGIHLPIVKRESPKALRRRGDSAAAIGLGDYVDVAYSVLLTVGGVTAPLILDSGSSDLWIMSDACSSGCGKTIPLYPQASFKPDGLDAKLFYGDSSSGTSAFGEVGQDNVDLAGLTLPGQYFAAINQTNTSISRTGSSGIFGLGFPINSVLWSQVFQRNSQVTTTTAQRRQENSEQINHHDIKYGNRNFPKFNFPSRFPTLPDVLTGGLSRQRRQVSATITSALRSFATLAPFLPRLVVTSQLALPLFTVSLQRNTVDPGGNVGLLTIGEMPSGVAITDLTWVPVRNYTYAQGGIPAPPESPTEVYPIAWEVLIDDVYLDGVKLPRSNLTNPGISLSALVDTGNSLVRGPEDVVQHIYETLSGSRTSQDGQFQCNEPHTLAFSIGGKLFPIDPRDLASQIYVDDVSVCGPNLVQTDPPATGGYLFSWSLGTPFLKSVLSAYHYGNITYPSQDPPRMGFLSTVPANANALLQSAVASAAKLSNFPMLSAPAPSGTPKTDSNGIVTVPTATSSTGRPTSSARRPSIPSCIYPMVFGLLAVAMLQG